MALSFRHLFAGLVGLLFAACSTKEPAPTPPSLEGKWLEQSLETNEYRADGSVLSLSGPVLNPNRVLHTITASLVSVQNPVTVTLYDYTRTGDELTFYPRSQVFNVPFKQSIVELSASALVLQARREQVSGGNLLYRFHFVRQ